MSWTKSIQSYFGGAEALRHIMATLIIALYALNAITLIYGFFWYTPLMAWLIGWFAMLGWEIGQHFFDTGFSVNDIEANTRSLPIYLTLCIPLLILHLF